MVLLQESIMARPHKPSRFQGWWVSKIAGTRTNLVRISPDDGLSPPPAAWARMGELLVEAQSANLTTDCLVSDLVAQYLVRPRGTKRTKRKNKDQLQRFLALFASRKVSSIRVTDADAWHNASSHLAGSTYNGDLRTARAVINFAIGRELFKGKNPFLSLKLRPETPRTRTITDQEFQALLALADEDQREILYCLRYTVSRPQDWEADWASWHGAMLDISEHKTAWAIGAKVLDIPAQIANILSARVERRGKQGPIFPRASKTHTWFKDMVKAAGIADKHSHPTGEDLTPYCLRHTCTTDAADRGASVKQLMALGSWKTPSMALRYVHVRDRGELMKLLG